MPISVEKTASGAWIIIKKNLAVTFCIGDLSGLPSQIVTINLDGGSGLQAGEHSLLIAKRHDHGAPTDSLNRPAVEALTFPSAKAIPKGWPPQSS
jgi:hypothetical protein